jgi:DNA-binding response OmpR family regulator
MHILVVDEDTDLREMVDHLLKKRGYWVTTVPDGESALECVQTRPIDLVLMDMLLPKLDGLEVCQRIREVSMVPLIMLSVRGSIEDIVQSLAAGADDFLAKPFNHRELLARVEALLRRCYGPTMRVPSRSEGSLNRGGILIDPIRHQVLRHGEAIRLTPIEFKLLYYLMTNEGIALNASTILERVWGYNSEVNDEVVRVNISRLRHKLETDPMRPRYIQTIPGVGYSFRPIAVS